MKNYRLIILLFFLYNVCSSQNIPKCMKEDIENLTYISCGFHTTIMKTGNGFQIFGAKSSPSGANLYYPTDISSANGFNYEGEIIHATLGEIDIEKPRMFILTTKGLYTWGALATTISTSLIPKTSFTKMKLPEKISPNEIKKIEASFAGLVILTKSGDVYVIGLKSVLFGDGSSDTKIWHKANIKNVKYISTADCVIFAYTNDGKYYTWGASTFLGDGSYNKSLSLPTEMISPFTGEPKMIVTGTGGAYFAIGSDKRIYALGKNNGGQLGTGSLSSSLKWTNVLSPKGSTSKYLENIEFINTTNNHSTAGSSSAITSDGDLYLWGYNGANTISDAAPLNSPQTTPITPTGFLKGSNKAIYVENGGHVTPYVDINLKKYGYVGHLTSGSMGNGAESGLIGKYDLINTPKIEFCFLAEIETLINCNDAEFNLTISDSNYTILWDFGDGSPTETSTNTSYKKHTYKKSGDYSVIIKIFYGDNNRSKILTKKITISGVEVNLGRDITVCDGTPVTLDAGNPGSSFVWNTGETSQFINIIKSGSYSVKVTDNNGCENSGIINVTINPKPIVNLGNDITVCDGTPVTLDAGNPGSSFIWNTGETSQFINIIKSGSYSVKVTDNNGCGNSGIINVTINPKPIVNLGNDITVCDGTPVTLDAGNPGSSFVWNTGETSQFINIIKSGSYSVKVTDNNGCENYGIINVTINPKPIVNLGNDITVCVGTPVLIDAGNSGSSFLWSNGETTQTIKVSTSGTYSVKVTNTNGCENTAQIKVTVNPKPVVNLGDDITVCEGTPVLIDAGNPGSSYLWSTGETTQTIKVSTSGTYSVKVTNTNGCENTAQIKVTVNPKPIINLGNDITVCEGTLVLIDAGNQGSSFLWSNGETTQSIKVSTSGTYSVKVTNANGCENTAQIKVTVNPKPIINLGNDITVCEGTPVLIDAGNPGSSYLWSNGETTQSIKVSTSGTYSVKVTNANGCENNAQIKVTVNPKPSINLGNDITVCEGTPVTLDAGNPGSSFIWNTGETSQFINIIKSGTYSVKVTDNNGCENSEQIKVTINPKPSINLGNDITVCEGTPVTLDAGNPGSSFIWNTGETSQFINIIKSGSYSVKVTDNNGCENSGKIKVTVNPKPSINLGNDITVCEGTPVTLDAGNPGSSFIWNTGETSQFINIIKSGTYSVKVTDNNGCENSEQIKVTINPKPVVNLGYNIKICKGNSITLDAGNTGSSFLWNTGEKTRKIKIFKEGIYSVIVTSKYGCKASNHILVNVSDIPYISNVKINKNSIEVIGIGNNKPLEYSLDLNYWQRSPIFKNLENKSFKAYARNSNNCISKPYPFIIINIPNAISPNGDGFNDVWNIQGLEDYPGSRIRVYNKYGNLLLDKIFTSNPVWDGKYLGRPVNTTSYWYIINLTDGRILTGWLIVRNYN